MTMWTYQRGRILNADGDVLASVPYTLGDKYDHANGRLMAAAPALLAACQEAATWLGTQDTPHMAMIDRLRAAIDAAT